MDSSTVYSKTARGVTELKGGEKNLSSFQLSTLKRIDGRSSFGSLSSGLGLNEQQTLQEALKLLEERQFIRVFTWREEARKIEVADIPFESEALPTIRIEELSPEEGVRAWAEARRGSRELAQLGFYTTAHLDPDGNITHDRNVLIVEDDPAISMLMKSYLSKQGFSVSVVADGKEALQELDDKPVPHIALLDVNLPNINGFDILTYIRANERLKSLPAIMVTAQVTDADVLRGLKGGADGYIFKPFEWAAFYTCIRRVLSIPE